MTEDQYKRLLEWKSCPDAKSIWASTSAHKLLDHIFKVETDEFGIRLDPSRPKFEEDDRETW